MTRQATRTDEHPWHLDLRPDPASNISELEVLAALRSLDAIGAEIVAVHADILPSFADIGAGRGYIGWTILVPGSTERHIVEEIAATAGPGYRAMIAPGHPLPPTADDTMSETTRRPGTAYPGSQITSL